jgi:hypothetical protein
MSQSAEKYVEVACAVIGALIAIIAVLTVLIMIIDPSLIVGVARD